MYENNTYINSRLLDRDRISAYYGSFTLLKVTKNKPVIKQFTNAKMYENIIQ